MKHFYRTSLFLMVSLLSHSVTYSFLFPQYSSELAAVVSGLSGGYGGCQISRDLFWSRKGVFGLATTSAVTC